MSNLTETLKNRRSTHGPMVCTSSITQTLLRVLDKEGGFRELPDIHKECLHMICNKMSRIVCGNALNEDNPHDIAGYATLLEEWITSQKGKE